MLFTELIVLVTQAVLAIDQTRTTAGVLVLDPSLKVAARAEARFLDRIAFLTLPRAASASFFVVAELDAFRERRGCERIHEEHIKKEN